MKAPNRLAAYLCLAAVAVIIAVVGSYFLDSQRNDRSNIIPQLGGPFTMVNQDGRTVTDADFRGKFMLIYFGYTFCPDVCPTALTLMVDAMGRLGDDERKIIPIFFTVDPERDTPEYIKEYVSHFHPRMVGLTGSPKQAEAAMDAYKVYAAKVQEEGSDAGDYAMDHSSIIYLMGPDGKYRTHFGGGITPKTIAKRIREFL